LTSRGTELGGGSVGVRLGIGVGDVTILLGDGDGRRGGSGDGGWRKPPGPWRSARSAPSLGLGCVRRACVRRGRGLVVWSRGLAGRACAAAAAWWSAVVGKGDLGFQISNPIYTSCYWAGLNRITWATLHIGAG